VHIDEFGMCFAQDYTFSMWRYPDNVQDLFSNVGGWISFGCNLVNRHPIIYTTFYSKLNWPNLFQVTMDYK
jgi:hypothetical protein